MGPPQYRSTDKVIEHLNSEKVNCFTPFKIRHSPRTANAPWTNGLVEVQNKLLGTHLRMFRHGTPKNWSIHVHFVAYAHKTQPSSHMYNSPYERVFHTKLRFTLNFQFSLPQNSFCQSTAQNCLELLPHSHYQSADLNLLLHSTNLKRISTCFLGTGTATPQKVYHDALNKEQFSFA